MSDSEIDPNSLFKCDVCLNDYGPLRQQKFLPCLHSFCQSCLTEIQQADGAIKCPVCRLLHVDSRVSSLPNNYFEALKKLEREKNNLLSLYAEVVEKQKTHIQQLDHFLSQHTETIGKLKQLVDQEDETMAKLNKELHDKHKETIVLLMHIISGKEKVIHHLQEQVAILEKARN